jgi:hypothetical protein
VHVLDDDDRLAGRTELGDQRVEHRLDGFARRRGVAQPSADGGADVGERAQRTRRPQPVARARQDTRAVHEAVAELADEVALADPRVAGDEDEAPFAACGGRERLLERRQRVAALEERCDCRGGHARRLSVPARGLRPLRLRKKNLQEVLHMAAWVWVLVAVAIVAVLAVVLWQALARRRTGRLQKQFGPEYDRAVGSAESRREAEADLQAREERRQQLDITPLSQAARVRYMETWRITQAQFVDDPRGAVAGADRLIQSVMAERGYPVDDFEQRAADISVDHPQVVENYREGHRLARASADGDDSTEALRQAMRHYRALFDDLVEPAGDEPVARERAASDGRVSDPEQVR